MVTTDELWLCLEWDGLVRVGALVVGKDRWTIARGEAE